MVMRSRQFALFAAISLLVGAMAPSVALGHTSKAAFDWHVGDALLQSFGFPVGEQAMAPNGDVVTLIGTGSFSADGKWATGGGTFSHHVAAVDATVTGTWTADSLISFQSYGCGEDMGEPLPPDFCGGLLKLAVTATPDANPALHLPAALTINCEIGTDVPASVIEGIRLNVYDFIHFNKPVPESGANLYIAQ
jgi:hypothetical protein